MSGMGLNPHLNFNGTCAEAFRFYAEHLGGVVDSLMTFAELPDSGGVDPAWADRVWHAGMALGGARLMGSDLQGAEPMRSAYFSLGLDSPEEFERVFAALSDGGEAFMPVQEMFFASRVAQLRDRFGVNWMLVHERSLGSGASRWLERMTSGCGPLFWPGGGRRSGLHLGLQGAGGAGNEHGADAAVGPMLV